jgi:hypothetical protein
MDETKFNSIRNAIKTNDVSTFVQLLGRSDSERASNAMCFINIPDFGALYKTARSPFLMCARYGRYEMLQFILNTPGIDINQQDAIGQNAVATVILSNKIRNTQNALKCAKLLLSNQSFNINAVDCHNRSAIMWTAADGKQYEMLKLLLKHNEIDIKLRGTSRETALFFAISRNCPIHVRHLLQHSTLVVQDASEEASLHRFMRSFGGECNLQCARQLLNYQNVNINYIDEQNTTAQSLTLDHRRYIAHALLIHGRI